MNARTFVSLLGSAALLAACASSAPPVAVPGTVPSAAPPASRPASDAEASRFGVLVMAHGGSPEWNQTVLEAVQPLRKRYDIEVAFGMADAASLEDAVAKLEARKIRRIGVLRLFISGESFLEITEQVLGLRPGAPLKAPAAPAAHAGHAGHAAAGGHGGHTMAFHRVATHAAFALSTHGLADADGMGAVLADRAAQLSRSPAQEDVLILAHGPGDDAEDARWLAKLDARAAAVRARAPFRRVQVETLREDWPEKRAAAETRIRAFVQHATDTGGRAIVIPFRVTGFGPYAKVLDGLDYIADQKGLLPHDQVTRWIESEIGALEAGPFRPVLPAT